MTTLLMLVFLAALTTCVVSVYLLGFRLGGRQWLAEVERVKEESIRASRAMNDLTRQALVAVLDEAERRRAEIRRS